MSQRVKEAQTKIMSRFSFSLGVTAFTMIGLLLIAPCAISATPTKVPPGRALSLRFVHGSVAGDGGALAQHKS